MPACPNLSRLRMPIVGFGTNRSQVTRSGTPDYLCDIRWQPWSGPFRQFFIQLN